MSYFACLLCTCFLVICRKNIVIKKKKNLITNQDQGFNFIWVKHPGVLRDNLPTDLLETLNLNSTVVLVKSYYSFKTLKKLSQAS